MTFLSASFACLAKKKKAERVEELSIAITAMTPWKVPGKDGIPADLLQHCKFCLLPLLHKILVKCWREGKVPQDMCDDKIITLYKNKGRIATTTGEFPFLELLVKLLHV